MHIYVACHGRLLRGRVEHTVEIVLTFLCLNFYDAQTAVMQVTSVYTVEMLQKVIVWNSTEIHSGYNNSME